jgi:hypothetical protein
MDTLRSCLPASHDKSRRKLYAAWTNTTMAMSPYKRRLQMQRSPNASLPLYPAQSPQAMSRPQEKGEDIHNEEVGISGVPTLVLRQPHTSAFSGSLPSRFLAEPAPAPPGTLP